MSEQTAPPNVLSPAASTQITLTVRCGAMEAHQAAYCAGIMHGMLLQVLPRIAPSGSTVTAQAMRLSADGHVEQVCRTQESMA